MQSVYGFSIIEIVKDNPKEKTVHFSGIMGQAAWQRYMDMTMDRDGNVKLVYLQPSTWPSIRHSIRSNCPRRNGEGGF